MSDACLALANNDIAYIFWQLKQKIPGCLGFAVHRIAADGSSTALPAFVGFEPGVPGQPRQRKTTDEWPVQSFQWKDVFAAPGTYSYRVVPMMGPDVHALVAHPTIALESNQATIGGDYGDVAAYFNVGLISTQEVTRQIHSMVANGTYGNITDALKGEIAKQNSPVRKLLSGDVLNKGLLSLLTKAKAKGGFCNLALYELTDSELIKAIKTLAAKDRLALCLSNADTTEEYKDDQGVKHTRKVQDGTNADTRKALHKAGVNVTDRFVPSSSIGHNKFVVWSSDKGPQEVLTGSTNWTPTGLCSQTNNALIIRNSAVAQGYKDYWDWLVYDASLQPAQGKDLRAWCGGGSVDASLSQGEVHVWFSPNTAAKTKNANQTPPDLAEVFALIQGAQHGVLFLAFNAGAPSFIEQVHDKAVQMENDGKPFYVRGAVTDPAPLGQFATFITKRSATVAPDVLVSGVGGIPDDFGYWEKEMYKLGHAVIHDKIIVIDPFSPDCVVVTGSHNLGFKASYQNDEKLVIVRGHQRLAQAYAAHVLDVTNHFSWRYKLSQLQHDNKLDQAWGDLSEKDTWQDKYFDHASDASRDGFFFLGA
ncbi:phospholipase D-like domain-containing protein [Rhodoferax sp. GW822-FHT02A01]|uniref:phospholipase D-like domain-containing protein n=1 Tax=Rhodoferax sp. GW822-FHT02A01 TaxID=3141537 RepID=UPI00315CA7D2